MSITAPSNEQAILPTLNEHLRTRYEYFKAAANRVSEKHPDMNTQIYTDYLGGYLDKVQTLNKKLESPADKPLHPYYIRNTINEAEREFSETFFVKYPTFTNATDPAELAKIQENQRARERWRVEIEGKGWIDTGLDMVRDSDTGAIRWGNIAGGSIGLLLGGLMGNYIGGAGGGGWMGMAATVLLALSGAAFGAKMSEYFTTPATPAPTPQQPSQSQTPAQAPAVEPAKAQELATNEVEELKKKLKTAEEELKKTQEGDTAKKETIEQKEKEIETLKQQLETAQKKLKKIADQKEADQHALKAATARYHQRKEAAGRMLKGMDTNHSKGPQNTVSMKELRQAIDRLGKDHVAKTFDLNEDGQIQSGELQDILASSGLNTSARESQEATTNAAMGALRNVGIQVVHGQPQIKPRAPSR